MTWPRVLFAIGTVAFVAAQTCDPFGPQSLNGSCNNLGEGRTRDGAAFERFEFLTGQNYKRGENEVLRFILSEELAPDEPNTYAIEPPEGSFLSSAACSPTGGDGYPRCTHVGVVDEYAGVGPSFDANPRLMSLAFHSVDVPASNDGTEHKATLQPGVSRILPFFGQFLAHDVFGDLEKDELFDLVDVAGIPNLDDPNNPIRQTGIELEDSDILAQTAPLFVGTDFDTKVAMIGGPTAEAVYDEDGKVEEIEITNTRTVWVDLDAIYGQDNVIGDYLRDMDGGEGKLRLVDYEFEASRYNPSAFSVSGLPPPISGLPNQRTFRVSGGIRDFIPTFGDVRNGENIAIGTVHIAFIRYHNYLVDAVCRPKLEGGELDASYGSVDETLFQCARRFNIAVFQKIAYEDFIPILTGSELPEYEGYDPEVDSRLAVEANVAYRIHPAVPRNLPVANSDGSRDLRVDQSAIRGIPQFGDPEPGNIGFSGVAFDMFPIGTFPFILGQAGYITADSGLENDPFQQVVHGLLFSQCNSFNEEVDGILRGIPALAGIDVPAFTLKRLQQFGVRQYVDIAGRILPAEEGGRDSIYGKNGCPARTTRENKDDTHEIGLTMVFSPYGDRFDYVEPKDDSESENRITIPALPISVSDAASDDTEAEDPLACFVNLTGGNEATAEKLRNGLRSAGVTARVENIPLWTGIQYEPKAADGTAMLGRLGAHFVQDQMVRLRNGDRFHYENVLSARDIEDYVAKVTFSDVLRTAYGVTNIQDDAFHTPNDGRFIPGP